MRPPGTTVTACAALALASCALGVVLGRWTVAPVGEVPRGDAPTASIDLAPLVAELRHTNELLQGRHGEDLSASPVQASREPATTTMAGSDQLLAAINRLSAAVESIGGVADLASRPTAMHRGPGFPSLDAMWQRALEFALSEDPKREQLANDEFSQAHVGWTRDEVIERYGAPSTIKTEPNTLALCYQREMGPERGAVATIGFLINEGRVILVSLG